jgi:hypothetical protein
VNNPEKITGKELLQSLTKDIENLCKDVEKWLTQQNNLIERVAELENEIRTIKSQL